MGSKFSFMKNVFNGEVSETHLHQFPFFTTPRETDFKLMGSSIEEWLDQSCDGMKFDDDKKLPAEFVQGLREMGLFGLIIPEAFGGSELTQTMYCRVIELVATRDTSVALTVGAHSSIGLKALYLFGTPEQKAKYMPKLATGEMIAAFALTEPSAGSDAAAIKSRVVRDGDHYVLNGSKLWITNGALADFFTVFAQENIDGEDKITALIVTRDMGGVSHGPEEQKLGIKASSTVEVYFKDTRVPVANVLSGPGEGFKVAMAILNQGRLGLAAGAAGSMKDLLKHAVVYAKNRKAFQSSIAEFGIIQGYISTMAERIYALESMTYFTTAQVDQGDVDYSIEAAICKVFGTESAWELVNIAMQIHGGNGYMKDYGLERKLRDGRIGIIFEGTNEILRLFIALTGIKEPAGKYKQIGKELQSLQSFKLDSLNAAIGKIGVISEFALKEVKKNVVQETLEGFHPALEKEASRLASATKELSSAAGKLIRAHGAKLIDEQLQLARLADLAIDTFMIAATLSRINTVLQKMGGPEAHASELRLAQLVIRNAKARINQAVYDLKSNRDDEIRANAKFVTELEKYPFPIADVNPQKA